VDLDRGDVSGAEGPAAVRRLQRDGWLAESTAAQTGNPLPVAQLNDENIASDDEPSAFGVEITKSFQFLAGAG
jgi:hypothetical protein